MADSWSWAAYLYEEGDDIVTMSNQYEDDRIMAQYIKASSSQRDVLYNRALKPHSYIPATVYSDLGATCLMCGLMPVNPIHNFPPVETKSEPRPWPADKLRVRAIKEDNTIRIEVDNPPTVEGERVLREVLPKVLEDFLIKNGDYEDFQLADLGPKAHFVGIWRKIGKVKRALWDDKPLGTEQVSEVLGDLVGHILLALLGLTRPKA